MPLFLLSMAGCSSITPGFIAIKVQLNASSDAERYTVIHGGRYWASPNVDYYEVPTMEQRSVWTAGSDEGSPINESISFAGKDGQSVNVDVGVGYILSDDDDLIVKMVRTYGLDLDRTIDGKVRDSVRNALNMCSAPYTVEQIYGEAKGPLFDCALKNVNDEFSPNGLNVVRLTLNSEIRLPEQVMKALENAVAASQEADKTRRQLEQTKAEGEKTVAQAEAEAKATLARATAQAEANRILAASTTPAILELKRLDNQRAQIDKWNGVLPVTSLGGATPLLEIGDK